MRKKIIHLLTFLVIVMTMAIPASAYELADLTPPASAEAIVYGRSGAGRDLTAYKFGSGSNVLVAGFAIHGYEDNFARDGLCLVYTADKLMDLLAENTDTITDYGWTVYVLPCMNPDGIADGTSCNGPGRCSTTYLDSAGTLITGTGIDINRSFPAYWQAYSSVRNFNGPVPLASYESKALAEFLESRKGSGTNLCLDVHGWYQQIITSEPASGKVFEIFSSAFPGNEYTSLYGAPGYFTAYAASLGYTSCLFEFPGGIFSFDAFASTGYCEKFNSCVLKLLEAYGTYSHTGFSDVKKSHWHYEAVDFVTSQGLIDPISATSFAPDQAMSRAALVTALWRVSGCPGGLTIDAEDEAVSFYDVALGSWYSDAVTWAASNGIVNGYNDGGFHPEDSLTREQLAAVFYRFYQWQGKDVSAWTELTSFADSSAVSEYALEPMSWACGSGIISGSQSSDGLYLLPQSTATRAQTAAILQRCFASPVQEATPQEDTVPPVDDSGLILA